MDDATVYWKGLLRTTVYYSILVVIVLGAGAYASNHPALFTTAVAWMKSLI